MAIPQILLTSAGRGWNGISADFAHFPRGVASASGNRAHMVGMHFGPPVHADCRVGDSRSRGLQMPGDIAVVPAGADGVWEDAAACHILRVTLDPSRIDRVARDLERNLDQIDLRPQFSLRDSGLEAICRAVKAELETPSDPLYIELLADALAVRLIATASASSTLQRSAGPQLPARKLRALTGYIEARLDEKLPLTDLAAVAGVGATQLKMLFRNTTGVSVHQYVLQRRVERARTLLATSTMAASQIALASGFAHQSHMAATMRRLTGQTPRDIVRAVDEFRPKLR